MSLTPDELRLLANAADEKQARHPLWIQSKALRRAADAARKQADALESAPHEAQQEDADLTQEATGPRCFACGYEVCGCE